MRKILCIFEDSDQNNLVYSKLIQSGIIPQIVNNRQSGINYILNNKTSIDCLVLDHDGDKINALEITKTLRKYEIYIPIIITSKITAVSSIIKLLESGADDYIVKPYVVNELIARINSICKRITPDLSHSIKVGAIEIDTIRYAVSINGKELKLGLKEYKLLYTMIINRNKLVSRDQLQETLWEYGTSIRRNSLDVYITRIRKKLADQSHLLKTIHKIGFRFEESKI